MDSGNTVGAFGIIEMGVEERREEKGIWWDFEIAFQTLRIGNCDAKTIRRLSSGELNLSSPLPGPSTLPLQVKDIKVCIMPFLNICHVNERGLSQFRSCCMQEALDTGQVLDPDNRVLRLEDAKLVLVGQLLCPLPGWFRTKQRLSPRIVSYLLDFYLSKEGGMFIKNPDFFCLYRTSMFDR